MTTPLFLLARRMLAGSEAIPPPVVIDEPEPEPPEPGKHRADDLWTVDWLESRARSYMWDAHRIDNPKEKDDPRRASGGRLSSRELRAIAGELQSCARDLAARSAG